MQHTAQDAARVTSLFMILVIASLINMFAVKISTQKFQEGNSLPHDLIIFTVYVLIGNALLSIATARFCTKEAESSVVTVSASPMSFLRILIAGGLRACISLCGTSMLFFAPVSLAEAVKATAPAFTLFIAYAIRGELATFPAILR